MSNRCNNKDDLELRHAAVTILACKQAIPRYGIISKLLGLPTNNDILAGYFYLNAIVEAVQEHGDENLHLNHVSKCLGKVKTKFRIKLAL